MDLILFFLLGNVAGLMMGFYVGWNIGYFVGAQEETEVTILQFERDRATKRQQ